MGSLLHLSDMESSSGKHSTQINKYVDDRMIQNCTYNLLYHLCSIIIYYFIIMYIAFVLCFEIR